MTSGSYSYLTWANLKATLAARLHDTSSVFWSDTELGLYLAEALRMFGALSYFWRARMTVTTDGTAAFYDLPSQSSSPLAYTVTDRDLINQIQYHLLEPATSSWAGGWTGTAMFTMADVSNAIQRAVDQFLVETGVVITRSTQAVANPALGRVALAEAIIDVRRAVWKTGAGVYSYIHRVDEHEATQWDSDWTTAAASVPIAYSLFAPPPLYLQMVPYSNLTGTLELHTINQASTYAPTSSATVLGIPDSLAWAVKWAALADLLGKDGPARDPMRAKYCAMRYAQGIEIAKASASVLLAHTTVPITPAPLFDIDMFRPGWQATTATIPTEIALVGLNMIATYPVSTGATGILLDVVRPALLYDVSNYIQVGKEHMDAILDWAEHIATFKMGGQEFDATMPRADNFIRQALLGNARLKAVARNCEEIKQRVWGEEVRVPRV